MGLGPRAVISGGRGPGEPASGSVGGPLGRTAGQELLTVSASSSSRAGHGLATGLQSGAKRNRANRAVANAYRGISLLASRSIEPLIEEYSVTGFLAGTDEPHILWPANPVAKPPFEGVQHAARGTAPGVGPDRLVSTGEPRGLRPTGCMPREPDAAKRCWGERRAARWLGR